VATSPIPRDDVVLDTQLHALADARRRALLRIVRDGALPAGEIASRAGLSQQTASHHLRILSEAGLATMTREGTRRLYAVRTDGADSIRRYLDDFWPTHLARLKEAVEASVARDDGRPATDDPHHD
jgi:DNA-binding transcriptional ArsR family regulator